MTATEAIQDFKRFLNENRETVQKYLTTLIPHESDDDEWEETYRQVTSKLKERPFYHT